MSILEVNQLKKIYSTRFGGNQVEALTDVNFSVEEGEYIAIMGESGSGKTTLLNILAALDKPTSGNVILDGKDISKIGESKMADFRRSNIGFVFQDFNLLDTFTLEDNIFLPLVLSGKKYKDMKDKLNPIAKELRIEDAKRMLISSPETPASKIGESLGISDKADFRHQFKSVTGLAPSEWREKNMKKNKEKFGI